MTTTRTLPIFATDATLHLVRLREGDLAMSADVADEVAHQIFERTRGFVSVEAHVTSPEDVPILNRLVSLVRDRGSASRRSVSLLVRAPRSAVTPEMARALHFARAPLRVRFEGPLTEADIHSVRAWSESVAATGTSPLLASMIAEIPLNKAVFDLGAEELIKGCLWAGLSFIDLLREEESLIPSEHRDLHLSAIRRLLDAHESGSLLIEMGLALHLETLALYGDSRRGGPPPFPRKTVWTAGGLSISEPEGRFGEGCGPCRYDPFCGRGLLQDPLENMDNRREGTSLCVRSKAMFEIVTALSASPEAARVRAMFRAWWAAHKQVAAHLSSL